MEWIKLWTTLHDDPGVKRLSDRAFRLYINAWSFAGLHETDGIYEVFGKVPREVSELLQCGKFIATTDPQRFEIRGWKTRQRTVEQVEAQRAAGKAAADARWNATRNANRIANGNTEKRRGEKSRGELPPQTPPAPSGRDELFETVAEVCGIDWTKLTSSARGEMNRAVAQLRGVSATPDETRRRASNWPYEVPLTPPALAKHWPSLDVRRATGKRSKHAELSDIANALEAQGL